MVWVLLCKVLEETKKKKIRSEEEKTTESQTFTRKVTLWVILMVVGLKADQLVIYLPLPGRIGVHPAEWSGI